MRREHYLSKKIYREKTVVEIEKKIHLLGVSTKLDVYQFLNIRLWGMILLFFIILFANDLGYLIAPIASFLYYKGITYVLLDEKIKRRQVVLEREALNFFEILTLSLETGRNLQEALTVTLSSCDGELVREFREVMREVKFGKSLTEALEDIQKRINER